MNAPVQSGFDLIALNLWAQQSMALNSSAGLRLLNWIN